MTTSRRHVVVMVATSYPRFPGDNVGSFMEPIAHGVAARGHEVHLVAPWHPAVTRGPVEGGVRFHYFTYAPTTSLNVFGYAGAMRADVRLKGSAYLVAPLALARGWHKARAVAQEFRASVLHGHWVIPGGAMAAAAGDRPLVVSLHGSDVFVAERNWVAGRVARWVFGRAGWVTACSRDLLDRAIALGARSDRSEVVPYGVDTDRFAPQDSARVRVRTRLGLDDDAPLLFTAGRFVRKKGFDVLIDAAGRLVGTWPSLRLVIGGAGDLEQEYRERARAVGLGDRLLMPGMLPQDDVAAHLAAADVAVVPSVRDAAGNVDGLPNVVMEALASATPLVATRAGGIAAVVEHEKTGLLVDEGDAAALAAAIATLLEHPEAGRALGRAARHHVETHFTWPRVAERFEAAYDAATASHSGLLGPGPRATV